MRGRRNTVYVRDSLSTQTNYSLQNCFFSTDTSHDSWWILFSIWICGEWVISPLLSPPPPPPPTHTHTPFPFSLHSSTIASGSSPHPSLPSQPSLSFPSYLYNSFWKFHIIKYSEHNIEEILPPSRLEKVAICLHDLKHHRETSGEREKGGERERERDR